RDVRPKRMTGKERPTQIIEGALPAYVGRQERTAYQLMRKCVAEEAAVFLTLSGAMTPAGLHQSCLIPLLERGIIDCITTTGANLYHDAHRVIGHRIREIAPDAGDLGLRVARIIRIAEDELEMGAVQHHCFSTLKKTMAIWILGGGVPKNYTLQGEPLLDQILGVPTSGFDIDVQFCVDPVDNGALSSCPAGEGHTWGKVSVEAVEAGSVYVHTDVTAVFPWLTHALLSDPKLKRKPQRLLDRLDEARAFLDP